MLFRQSLDIEQQQIATIVDARAVMLAYQTSALTVAIAFIARSNDTQRSMRVVRLGGQSLQLLDLILTRHDAQLYPIERTRLFIGKEVVRITAMRIEVLQLRSTTTRDTSLHQLDIESLVGTLHPTTHKDLAHQCVDKRRVNSVTTIVAHVGRTHRSRSNAIQAVGYGFQEAHSVIS